VVGESRLADCFLIDIGPMTLRGLAGNSSFRQFVSGAAVGSCSSAWRKAVRSSALIGGAESSGRSSISNGSSQRSTRAPPRRSNEMTVGPASFTVHDEQPGQRNRYVLCMVSMQQRIVNTSPGSSTSPQLGQEARIVARSTPTLRPQTGVSEATGRGSELSGARPRDLRACGSGTSAVPWGINSAIFSAVRSDTHRLSSR